MKQELLTINESIDVPFFAEIMEQCTPTLLDLPKRKGYIENGNNHHLLTESEKRISRIFRLLNSLSTTTGDIRICYHLIKRRPIKVFLNRNSISELDYMRYHYEVFIHKIHTINEVMKLVANEVLELGLHPKDCTWINLLTYSKFNNSNCKNAIDKNFKDFRHLIEDRHLNTHRGLFEDKEMDKISPLHFICNWYDRHNLPIDSKISNWTIYSNYEVRMYKKNKLKEIIKYEQIMLKNLNLFLKSF